jgi:glycosyltransferase involved in cell wall biosynthesis
LDEPSQQHGFVRRLRQESRYGSRLSQRIATFKPQVTISANTPLGPQSSAARATSAAGAAFIFWVQDLYSVAVSRILERRLGGLGTLIGRRFESAERRILRGSDAVVAIAPEFTPVLESWGVVPERVTVIENWASLDLVRPKSKRNRWSEANGLGDVPVLMYAGTLGRKHDPALLVHLAQALPDVKVVVVAEGAGADALRGGAMPENLLTWPMQPANDVAEVLATADVLIALLEPDASEFSVPSKVLTYLTAGRPILAAMPPDNLAARTVLRAAAGQVVHPGDHQALAVAAASLLDDVEGRRRMAASGRAYAEATFGIGPIADRFEAVVDAARIGHRV